MANRLIAIPFGHKLVTEIIDCESEEIALNELGIYDPIIPYTSLEVHNRCGDASKNEVRTIESNFPLDTGHGFCILS